MRAVLYWTLCILLLASVVHLGYVLIVPHFEMRANIDQLREFAGDGALTVLDREDSIRLMGPDGRWIVHALCIYDLARGPMIVSAAVPGSYWSMAIYSAGGDNFYSLNDRQAGIDRVNLMIRQPSASLLGDEQELAPPDDETITVRAPDRIGVVVMRALAGEPAEYALAAETLGQSECRTRPG